MSNLYVLYRFFVHYIVTISKRIVEQYINLTSGAAEQYFSALQRDIYRSQVASSFSMM